MFSDTRVSLLGAGVAGLAAATALAGRGAKVTILEQAPAITEVGAGLQISPNGMRVLRALGLGAEAEAAGMAAEAIELYDGETGQLVTRLDLLALAPRGDFRFFHRADLIAMLEGGARRAGALIRTDCRVASVDLSADGAALALADGTTEHAGLVIGADGLHSVLRPVLNGPAAPFFTGQVAWRATLPATGAIPPVARVYMGPGRHLVTYPLRGGHLRNIVAVEEREIWAEESWTLTDDALALRLAYEGFIPEVRGWLDQIGRPNLWGLFRHPVARHWVQGGVAALLGDAAHPTLPFLAQGANLALEDAWVLAAELDRGAARGGQGIGAGLAAYEAARQPRAEQVIAAANANARNFHLDGLKRDLAHVALRLADRFAPRAAGNRFRWVYDFDATKAG